MYVVTSDSRQISSVVGVLTVSSAKLYAEDELKIRQKSTEISREYPILTKVTVSWMHPTK